MRGSFVGGWILNLGLLERKQGERTNQAPAGAEAVRGPREAPAPLGRAMPQLGRVVGVV